MNTLSYKGYTTIVHYDTKDRILYGHLEGINDIIPFEAKTTAEVEPNFRAVVDEYLAFCEHIGKSPEVGTIHAD